MSATCVRDYSLGRVAARPTPICQLIDRGYVVLQDSKSAENVVARAAADVKAALEAPR